VIIFALDLHYIVTYAHAKAKTQDIILHLHNPPGGQFPLQCIQHCLWCPSLCLAPTWQSDWQDQPPQNNDARGEGILTQNEYYSYRLHDCSFLLLSSMGLFTMLGIILVMLASISSCLQTTLGVHGAWSFLPSFVYHPLRCCFWAQAVHKERSIFSEVRTHYRTNHLTSSLQIRDRG